MSHRLAVAVSCLLALSGACGGDAEDDGPNVLRAGQVDIQLPEGWTVTEQGATRPADEVATATTAAGTDEPGAPAAASSDDTVPLAEDDPQTAFFKSVRVFQQCLDERGTTFIGVPDQSNPSSPTNDPAYLEDLGTCASKSNILQALEEVRAFEDALSPTEIEERNEQYLDWRDCMTGRGWGIPDPKPDEKGRLFTFGGGGNSGPPQFDPPPGQDLFTSDDIQECIEEVA